MMRNERKTMNWVEVTGGNKTQRKVAEITTHQMIAELLPRFRTLDIEVQLKKFHNEDAIGWCLMQEDNRTFVIEINKDIGITELVTTVCHEMVHVKQYARNEMTDELVESGHAVWKGRKIHPNTGYYQLPWEKEAYKLQDKLALKVWKSGEI